MAEATMLVAPAGGARCCPVVFRGVAQLLTVKDPVQASATCAGAPALRQVVLREDPQDKAGDDEVFALMVLLGFRRRCPAQPCSPLGLLLKAMLAGQHSPLARLDIALVQRWPAWPTAGGTGELAWLRATWQQHPAHLAAVRLAHRLGPHALHHAHEQAPGRPAYWLSSEPRPGATWLVELTGQQGGGAQQELQAARPGATRKPLNAWVSLTALAARGQLAGLPVAPTPLCAWKRPTPTAHARS
ncbi:MAG: hypothetical protein U5L74_12270 [Ideonella sp.]|nr:hypothetical protein [Ideonella sp.]